MNRLEKCKLAIEKGYIYNPETGNVYSKIGRQLYTKTSEGYLVMSIYKDKKSYLLYQHQFAWFYINNEIVLSIDHINQNKSDNRIINLRSVSISENNRNRGKFNQPSIQSV
jgi:hypothetical protein